VGRWTSLFATLAILLYSAQDFFFGAVRDIRNRRLGMDIPIVIGLTAAFCGSLVATIAQHGEVYFDTIAMFVLFVLTARRLEMRGRARSAEQLDRLAVVAPQSARRLHPDGREEMVAAVELAGGDLVRVLPGEALPADGLLVEGASSFDEAILTGEPLPVDRGEGEAVLGGSHNRDQPVTIRVTRVGAESTAGEVRRLLHAASASRPRLALLAERAASWFILCALLVAAATAAAWLWIDPSRALASTVSVLIITCPCALALAAPAANAFAMGSFVAAGVLPLRAEAIETIARADTVALDKTGTLTEGRLALAGVAVNGDLSEAGAVAIATALEAASEHPVAQALRRKTDAATPNVTRRRNHPGEGVSGEIAGRAWRLGKPVFAAAPAGMSAWAEAAVAAQRTRGRRVAALADDSGVRAVLAFDDRLREGAKSLSADLFALGIGRVAILSGDAEATLRNTCMTN